MPLSVLIGLICGAVTSLHRPEFIVVLAISSSIGSSGIQHNNYVSISSIKVLNQLWEFSPHDQ